MTNLEKYPHIVKKLTALWPEKECSQYLETLLLVTDRLERDGFEPEVFDEIFFLLSIHMILFPPSYDPWEIHQ